MDIDISILIMLNVCWGGRCVTWWAPESDSQVRILDLPVLTPWPWAVLHYPCVYDGTLGKSLRF